MKITVKKGDLGRLRTDAAVVCHFEGRKTLEGAALSLDKQTGGLIRDVVQGGDFEGKINQVLVIYTREAIPAKRIVLVGLGKKVDFNLEKLRGAFARAAQQIRQLKLKEFATTLALGRIDQPVDRLAGAVVEGVLLGLYRFLPFKTMESDVQRGLAGFAIVEDKNDRLEVIKRAVGVAETICRAVYFARDMVSMPSNEMTPTRMAEQARQIARGRNLKLEVLDMPQMKTLGMNALLGVAKGSDEPAKFIILTYTGGKAGASPIFLVGKGLTFDSGGICIKPSEKMDEMKSDMAGGAAVMGALKAAAELGLLMNITGLIPAAENLPGGKAYKPGDILKTLSGQTIEVVNTDAEGRLILADALSYAAKFKPAAIIDIATLTGACVVALGDHVIGMLGTDEDLKRRAQEAAQETGEPVWELPLWEDYHELIKSDVADWKNSGGRSAGTITAAALLSKFVGPYPWLHLDIAGPAWLQKDRPYIPKGASGVGVRLLIALLRKWNRDGTDSRSASAPANRGNGRTRRGKASDIRRAG